MEKKINDLEKNGHILIPFGKASRVGNYKVWRSKFNLTPSDEQRAKVRKDSNGTRKAVGFEIEQINISNLDGSWSTKIPQTCGMYAVISMAYDNPKTEDRDIFLTNLFGNMLNVCTVDNTYIHDGFSVFLEMMQVPYLLLPEKEMVKRMKADWKPSEKESEEDIAKHINDMVKYRRELYEFIEKKKADYIDFYEKQRELAKKQEEAAMTDIENAEKAEEAAKVLNKED